VVVGALVVDGGFEVAVGVVFGGTTGVFVPAEDGFDAATEVVVIRMVVVVDSTVVVVSNGASVGELPESSSG
jgi:hypothetical protein